MARRPCLDISDIGQLRRHRRRSPEGYSAFQLRRPASPLADARANASLEEERQESRASPAPPAAAVAAGAGATGAGAVERSTRRRVDQRRAAQRTARASSRPRTAAPIGPPPDGGPDRHRARGHIAPESATPDSAARSVFRAERARHWSVALPPPPFFSLAFAIRRPSADLAPSRRPPRRSARAGQRRPGRVGGRPTHWAARGLGRAARRPAPRARG